MNTPTTNSRGTTILVTQTTLGSITQSQRKGTGSVQTNLFGEPRVGMAEAICERIRERRIRREEPVEEILSLSESEKDPVPDSSNSLEGEYEGTTTPSQPDDDPKSSPVPTHRPVTRSMPKKPTFRPKRKAYKTMADEHDSSSRKKPMD